MVINGGHTVIISRNLGRPQRRTHHLHAAQLLVGTYLIGVAVPAARATPSCVQALGEPAVSSGALKVDGTEPVATTLSVLAHHTYLVEVTESDNDALVEVLDAQDRVVVESDHPERRTGTRRAIVTAVGPALPIRVTGKEHAGIEGTARIRAFDLGSSPAPAECIAVFRILARADADYATAEKLTRGGSPAQSPGVRVAFTRAADEYVSAERALTRTEDHALRGQVALGIAGLDYLNLQDWSQAADWAQTAAGLLEKDDPYRRARADTVRATAWMEIGSPALIRHARALLQNLSAFHLKRGERYDAGLQITNVALTYYFEGRYSECIGASVTAARLFDSIHEAQRRAQAWQNQALCLWGLGHLSDALRWFEQAGREIGPDALPGHYLALTNNTALVNYALGHFDESLTLFDRALAFAEQVHSPRDEAASLYGIGVTYYSIGDKERARQFLERALAIRTVALDSRGRMATLRALANVDAEQGRVKQALSFDQEALGLAVAPSAVARIRTQTAVHTARAGQPEVALGLFAEVIGDRTTDPLVRAEARVQRAVVLRELGRPAQAQADLVAALPRLHAQGNIAEEFEADLELARALHIAGRPRAALKAIDEALSHADALRRQTANPELRMQLGTPLRAAYELKVELLRARYETALGAGQVSEAAAIAAAAFATADASRGHSLADFAAQEYPAVIRSALASEFERRAALYRELAARRFTLEARLDRSGSEDPRARQLMGEIADLERRADEINTAIARRAQAGNATGQSINAPIKLPKLPAGTALASYWLGSESAYVWAIPSGSGLIQWTRLLSPALIADRATRFHQSLTRLVDVPIERRLEDARALYELLIRPVEPALANARLWVIIPDRALEYVPFAALRSSDKGLEAFVATQHDIAVTPAAWLMVGNREKAKPPRFQKLLLIDDPAYQPDDPRLRALRKRAAPRLPSAIAIANTPYHDLKRLPFTAEEARRISAEFPAGEVDELRGLQATRERALSLDWSQYRYIHIAAHAIVDTQVPQLSALILGAYDAQGDTVEEAVRVSDLSLQTLTADVAVLSACDTAVGPQVESEGTVGLESTLLSRGARAVVASLWPVSDETSAQLMTDFYRHLMRDSMTAPAALGAAMRVVMTHERSADPALWATFQVSVAALGTAEDTVALH